MSDLEQLYQELCAIRTELASDKYEMLGFKTVGGGSGNYIASGPVNTECEWALVSVDATGVSPAGVVMISGANPGVSNFNSASLPTLGASTGGTDSNNAFDGFVVPIVGPYQPNLVWQPLGRGDNIYLTASLSAGGFYAIFAFRRKLKRVIPAPPRVKPHTHTVPSRRNIRTMPAQSPMTAGFGEQMPPENEFYRHQAIPETQDTASIGNVENTPYAQTRYRAYRNRGNR